MVFQVVNTVIYITTVYASVTMYCMRDITPKATQVLPPSRCFYGMGTKSYLDTRKAGVATSELLPVDFISSTADCGLQLIVTSYR